MFNIKRRLEKIVNKSTEDEDKSDLNLPSQSTKNVTKTKQEIELENLYREASKIKEEDVSKELKIYDVQNVKEVTKLNTESDIAKTERDSINDELKSLESKIEFTKEQLRNLQSENYTKTERMTIINELSLLKSEIEFTIDKLLNLK